MATDSSEDLSNSSGDLREDGSATDRPLHELDPSLARKLLSLRRDDDDPSEKDTEFSDGASILASKLLQHFVTCGARLAAIEAECDHETSQDDDDGNVNPVKVSKEHILRVAAELLMDFA
eukprot:CAMPEP_0194267264 /NCGR_PEP_ID=MMETSP0169-20130528/1842_1 /TAXON_ID=218684 /ORGANISM="Corethron pennatum, Strain L29A3" /LENGTH=119 /DNA_ID=CAMNT_0039008083 /DNA_START=84 /DNA_END=443 /DNA_ORIENTATION=+